ncbi:glycoside hydrolase family 10 protein [Sphaerobolus stellatus SS14]|nr:glycoside hydrolase family 10 protein [Sphaerobolus stellatus SS14]
MILAGLVPLVSSQSTGVGLNKVAKAAGKLYFGTATDGPDLSDGTYVAISNNTDEFGQHTPANALKWDATEPEPNVFTFTAGDQIVDITLENNQLFRGHNLVWHQQLPQWVTNGTWTNATLIAALETHISNVVGRYKGKFYAWDVVNEPLNGDGTLGQDIFSQTIGPQYIAIALRAAHRADPTAKLYINDFGIEGGGSKSTGMQNLVKSLKAEGAPIDGIGFESHFILGGVPTDLQQNIEVFVNLGVEVAITELDIRMKLPATEALLDQQKQDYQTAVGACVAVSKCVGITLWDFTDKFSWVPSTFTGFGAATPWDDNLILKPAYNGIVAAFNGTSGDAAVILPPTAQTNHLQSPSSGMSKSTSNAYLLMFALILSLTRSLM